MAHIASCIRPERCLGEDVYMSEGHPSSGAPSSNPGEDQASSPDLTMLPSVSMAKPTTPKPRQKSSAGSTASRSASPVESIMESMVFPMARSTTPVGDGAVLSFKRREMSLPKKREEPMTTVQEGTIDSPTIPGRPALCIKTTPEFFNHERSNSAPGGSWRQGPFGDALVSRVTGPAPQVREQLARKPVPLVLDRHKYGTALASRSTTRLSPIFSPSFGLRPTLRAYASTSNLKSPDEIPPAVPPKSPSMTGRGSPSSGSTSASKHSRWWPATPFSKSSRTSSPTTEEDDLPPPYSGIGPTPVQMHTPHFRNNSEPSILHRGRPVRKGEGRRRSLHRLETTRKEVKHERHTWKIPCGLPAREVASNYPLADQESLQNQARRQAEKFEVLSSKDVASLSKELRAIDERCEYLRKTFKSLRAGRQRLHSRMLTYLRRNDTAIFSRESLVKQEEALAELDASVDDWNSKLEQAENRRLRVRQKLLEHVAAALLLDPGAAMSPPTTLLPPITPPESPAKGQSPFRVDRKDVESIKIYADDEVLDLFASIEQAIGDMCQSAEKGYDMRISIDHHIEV